MANPDRGEVWLVDLGMNAYCSFCRKSYQDVGPLVEGPGQVYICCECASLCRSIVERENRRRGVGSAAAVATDAQGVRRVLDRLIPRQEDAKEAISEAACCRREGKGRVLLIGPSRASSMLLAKAVAFALDVPFAPGDFAALVKSSEGNLFLDLLKDAEFDLEAAQRGVMFVGGMESAEAQDAIQELWRKNVTSPVTGLTMDLRGLLFVCAASFAGMGEAAVRPAHHPEKATSEELLRAVGARPEWGASLAAVAYVPPLDEESLARIVGWVDFRRAQQGLAEAGN